MAKPRVFISSTFYDLRQIRADIDQFLKTMGYEPIRNEAGAIAYGKEQHLEDYCIREVEHSDVLISIIGGRFGSESKDTSPDQQMQRVSISQRELKTALEKHKQVYVFIDKNVSAEFETYRLNKEQKEIKYRYVDDNRIYQFIEEIKGLAVNNNIKDFETSEDIINYLREQFAGLFQRFLDGQIRVKEFSLITELQRTSQNLNNLVEYLSNQNQDKQKEIEQILMLNHPLVSRLREILSIRYNFYIIGYEDLTELLRAHGYRPSQENVDSMINEYSWIKSRLFEHSKQIIYISKDIFEDDNKLKNILPGHWKEEFIRTIEIPDKSKTEEELPF